MCIPVAKNKNCCQTLKGRINTDFFLPALTLHKYVDSLNKTMSCMFWAGPRESSSVKEEGKNTVDVPKMPCSIRTSEASQR